MPKPTTKQSSSQGVISEQDARKLFCDLANMDDDGVSRFRNKWGHLYSRRRYTNEDLLQRRDELRLLWRDHVLQMVVNKVIRGGEDESEEQWLKDFKSWVSDHTKSLYLKWVTEPDQLSREPLGQFICEYWLRLEQPAWVVVWEPRRKGFQANLPRLPAALASLCIRFADRMGFCRNPDCPAPYFLTRRSDQRFCTPDCAVHGQREAKRRWWHKQKKVSGSKPKKSTKRTTKGGKRT